MESFSHMKAIATAMRTGKPDGGISSRHLPPPIKAIVAFYYEVSIRIRLLQIPLAGFYDKMCLLYTGGRLWGFGNILAIGSGLLFIIRGIFYKSFLVLPLSSLELSQQRNQIGGVI